MFHPLFVRMQLWATMSELPTLMKSMTVVRVRLSMCPYVPTYYAYVRDLLMMYVIQMHVHACMRLL